MTMNDFDPLESMPRSVRCLVRDALDTVSARQEAWAVWKMDMARLIHQFNKIRQSVAFNTRWDDYFDGLSLQLQQLDRDTNPVSPGDIP